MDSIKAHLRERMSQRSISRPDVERRLGLSQGYVALLLRNGSGAGTRGLSVPLLVKFSILFGLSIDQMIHEPPGSDRFRREGSEAWRPDDDA